MNNNDHREQEYMSDINFEWANDVEKQDQKTSPVVQILKRPFILARHMVPKFKRGLFAAIFSKRQVDLHDRVISFNLGHPVHSGDTIYTPLENEYIELVQGYLIGKPDEYWVCHCYRVASSRWQSFWVRILHYLQFPVWGIRWIKSYLR